MSRIDSGTILVAFFAILFGLIGAFLLRKSLRSKNVAQPAPKVRSGPTKVTVPLASRDLKSGTQITLDDVALFRLTRQEMKDHGIKRVFMANPDQIIGKTMAVDLPRGSTFDTKDFYAPGTGPGIADKLKPGQRAVTIDVTATSALLGFAGAGQNVDVLFHYGQSAGTAQYTGNNYDLNTRYRDAPNAWRPSHFDYNAPRGMNSQGGRNQFRGRQYGYNGQYGGYGGDSQKYQNATVTLVQKATILALGQKALQTGNSSKLAPEERVRVTLAVEPESAELIRVAEGHGELSLTLRGVEDDEIVESVEPATLADIIKMEEQPIPEFAQQEVRDMDIYRGQSRSQVQFIRDRDTGADDFQRWILVRPRKPSNPTTDPEQIEPADQRPPDPNLPELASPGVGGQAGSSSRNVFNANNYPNGILIEEEQQSAQRRLESDFRKIRTLFNRNPELRERLDQKPPTNVDTPRRIDSDDLSEQSIDSNTRSAKAVELFDPRSWE